MNLFGRTWDFYFEWTATVVLIIAVALTSFNIYPANVWLSFIGNLGWMILGIIWRKWSLITVQAIITVIFASGIINTFIK